MREDTLEKKSKNFTNDRTILENDFRKKFEKNFKTNFKNIKRYLAIKRPLLIFSRLANNIKKSLILQSLRSYY